MDLDRCNSLCRHGRQPDFRLGRVILVETPESTELSFDKGSGDFQARRAFDQKWVRPPPGGAPSFAD
jgi:hypothetical protein